MQLKDSQTYLNLARAYSGECQAMVRYRFIEYGARMKGYNAMAEFIDKIVYNEFNHARMFYTAIQSASKEPIDNIEICAGTPFREKWDLTDNLNFAAMGENTEVELYREFSKVAKEEGFDDIANLFMEISKIEAKHERMFACLHDHMLNGTLYSRDKKTKWVCSGCGYEETSNEAFEICPVCKQKQGFIEVECKV